MATESPLETQEKYASQATILRKNILEWDQNVQQGFVQEDWPKTLGRLNAALNQTVNMDRSVKDVMEHFVYVPLKATANPQDIPFFLSTRMEENTASAASPGANEPRDGTTNNSNETAPGNAMIFSLDTTIVDPVEHLVRYETEAAKLAADYESQMIRF